MYHHTLLQAKIFLPLQTNQATTAQTFSQGTLSELIVNVTARVQKSNFLRLVQKKKSVFPEVGAFWDLSFVGCDRKWEGSETTTLLEAVELSF